MKVVDIERKAVDRLARDLAPKLAEGQMVVSVDEIHDLERWRKAARRAGRLLGQPVRTTLIADGSKVCAILDGPVRPQELQEAAEVVSALIFGSKRGALLRPENHL